MRYVNKRRKLRIGRLIFILIVCFGILCFVLVDLRIRPMIKTYGNNQTITTATKAVNDAVEDVLTQMSIQYKDLAKVIKDNEDKIASVETNTHNMNIVKSAVSKAILVELDKHNVQMVHIPMGSLVGGLFTGRGPNINIKVPMNSTVETAFYNHFEGAGINQTRHEITLKVKVVVYAVIQGEDTATEVETGFTIAENILIGEVPQWMISRQ